MHSTPLRGKEVTLQSGVHHRFWLISTLFALATMLPTSVNTVFLLGAGWDYVGVGVIFSLILGTSALSGGPAGLAADRWGRRYVLVGGGACLCLAMGGWAFNPAWGYLWAILQGVGTSSISSPLQAWAIDELPDHGKHTPNTLLARGQTWAKLGILAGSLVILVARIQDFRMIYWGAAAAAAVGMVLGWCLMEETQWQSRSSRRGKRPPASPQLIAATGYLVILFLCFSFYMFLWQPGMLARGLAPHQLPMCNGLFSLAAAASTYGLGLVHSRSGFTRIACLLPAGAGLGILISTSFTPLMASFLGYLLFHAAYYSSMVAGQILLNRTVDATWRATVLGGSTAVALTVSALSQPVLGSLVDIHGPLMSGRLAALLCWALIPLALLAQGKSSSQGSG